MKTFISVTLICLLLTACCKKVEIIRPSVGGTDWIGTGTNLDGIPINNIKFSFHDWPDNMYFTMNSNMYLGYWRDDYPVARGVFSAYEYGATNSFTFVATVSYDGKEMTGTFKNFNPILFPGEGKFKLKKLP